MLAAPPVPNAVQSYSFSSAPLNPGRRSRAEQFRGPGGLVASCSPQQPTLPQLGSVAQNQHIPIVSPHGTDDPTLGLCLCPSHCPELWALLDKIKTKHPRCHLHSSFPQRAACPQVSITLLRLFKGLPGLEKSCIQQRKNIKVE